MFKHYLLSALRNIWRHRVTSAINVASLAIGLVCFTFIYGAFTIFENSDRHFANADRIHFIARSTPGDCLALFGGRCPNTPQELAEHLRTDFPALEAVSQAVTHGQMALSTGAGQTFATIAFTDPQFLRIFALPFLHGDAKTALDRPRSLVLTREAAQEVFGTLDVVGRTLRMSDPDSPGTAVDLTVTGVLGALQGPTHFGPTHINFGANLAFSVLVSIDVQQDLSGAAAGEQAWQAGAYRTYVLFPRDGSVSPGTLNRDFPGFVRRHLPPDTKSSFEASPIHTLMLVTTGGAFKAILLPLGCLILAIACVNYANLATAQAIGRSKEIGLRKVLGARPSQLIARYLLESALLTAAALTAALFVIVLLLPVLSSLIDLLAIGEIHLSAFFLHTPSFWFALLLIAIAVTVAAGAYPAWISSRATPAAALRISRRDVASGFGLKVLVGIQFALASFLLVAIIVMNMQKDTLLNFVPDTAGDPIVVIDDLGQAGVNIDALGSEIRRSPHVRAFSATTDSPWTGFEISTMRIRRERDTANVITNIRTAYFDYFETVGIKLLAGRTFSRDRSDDVTSWSGNRPFNMVVEASFTAAMGWTPQEAVGKTVYRPLDSDTAIPVTIIGVVENRALTAAGGGAVGNIYWLGPTPGPGPSRDTDALVRVPQAELAAALRDIDAAWKQLAPTMPIERKLLTEKFEAFRATFTGVIVSVAVFSACGFLIAIAGLIGMATYVVAQRTHEIGVRKTLGSSVAGVLRLLLLSLSKPIVIGSILGWPLAYGVVKGLLVLFANPVAVTPTPFLLSLAITVAIGAASVAVPAWRAAWVNPADVLHYE